MKKPKIITIILVSILPVLLLVSARLFKWYVIYTLPTTSMDPNYKVDDVLIGSSLLNVKRGDVVSYKPNALEGENTGGYDYVCRIVAVGGDTVELRNTLLYVNGKMNDDTLSLSYLFVIKNFVAHSRFTKYQTSRKIFYNMYDSLLFNGSYNEIKALGIASDFYRIQDVGYPVFKQSNGNDSIWTTNNMGPIVVPQNNYFLIGDNRSNSADSRVRGFVPKEKIVAKIVN